eukprot:2903255-Rhodomonas_salina.1
MCVCLCVRTGGHVAFAHTPPRVPPIAPTWGSGIAYLSTAHRVQCTYQHSRFPRSTIGYFSTAASRSSTGYVSTALGRRCIPDPACGDSDPPPDLVAPYPLSVPPTRSATHDLRTALRVASYPISVPLFAWQHSVCP